MKFSAFSVLAFLGVPLVFASTEKRNLQQSCLNYADIEYGKCDSTSILMMIYNAIKDVEGCTNNARMEVMLLTRTEDMSLALTTLVEDCKANPSPCLNLEKDVVFPDCLEATVMNVTDAALAATSCQHDKESELKVQFQTQDWQIARQAMLDLCASRLPQVPCIEDLQSFATPPFCNNVGEKVADEVSSNANCTHTPLQEVQLHMGDVTWDEATANLKVTCESQRETCSTWNDVEVDSCDDASIRIAVRQQMADDCIHDVDKEMRLLSGTSNDEDARAYMRAMCSRAMDGFGNSTFADIDPELDDSFMVEYFAGGTHLNLGTGNFQGGEITRYPTPQRDRDIGKRINSFRDNQARKTVMGSVSALSSCQNQAMMCCFGRDRQANDNNGNCDAFSCRNGNADPADNSNLCYVGEKGTASFDVLPNAREGAVHCHGLAWAEDENDLTARLRYNNLFYVSMFDHMYSRGYVQSMVNRNDVPMCGCIEDMPVVTRADCTEMSTEAMYTFNTDSNGLLVAEGVRDSLNVQFNACKGVNPVRTSVREDNDLASYAAKLVMLNQMSDQTQANIHKTLVGFAQPNNNANERACRGAIN